MHVFLRFLGVRASYNPFCIKIQILHFGIKYSSTIYYCSTVPFYYCSLKMSEILCSSKGVSRHGNQDFFASKILQHATILKSRMHDVSGKHTFFHMVPWCLIGNLFCTIRSLEELELLILYAVS